MPTVSASPRTPDAAPPVPADRLPLTATDPSPVTVENAGGASPLLLLCDHAANAVPACLGDLGIGAVALQRHIAWDIGAAAVTRRLAQLCDAAAVYAGYSRLVIDINRGFDDPTLVPMISDGTVIPANRDLSQAAIERRIDRFYRPYDAAVAGEIARIARRGQVPVLVSIHSFTPVMRGFTRPWHIGVLWDRDGRLALPLLSRLAADADLVVGDNQPYSGRGTNGSTLDRHAAPFGLPHILLEIRQDLIADSAGANHWADRLHRDLTAVLAATDLQRSARSGVTLPVAPAAAPAART